MALRTRNFRCDVFECGLSRDDVPVGGWAIEYVKRGMWQQTATLFVSSALLVCLGLAWGWSTEFVATGLLAVGSVSYLAFGRGSGYVIRPLVRSAGAA